MLRTGSIGSILRCIDYFLQLIICHTGIDGLVHYEKIVHL